MQSAMTSLDASTPVQRLTNTSQWDRLRVCTRPRCNGAPDERGRDHGTGGALICLLVSRALWLPLALVVVLSIHWAIP